MRVRACVRVYVLASRQTFDAFFLSLDRYAVFQNL